ncbi:hypothetical protein EUGRSUZ_F00694 [Eucalyptus grandis]|uniref:Uncharacterized protein n=2 Tax=Eucalyptus grandis TaxID=71139 RepID=A0A059BLJ3_EUCGR|nr:hypothetical protein EUGRSUZ_F00694 [Eucalyptus grandis]
MALTILLVRLNPTAPHQTKGTFEKRERKGETPSLHERRRHVRVSRPPPLRPPSPSPPPTHHARGRLSFSVSASGLWRGPREEPPLLRGAALRPSAPQPARHLARPLRPHRWPRARGGLGRRILRRRRKRQVRPPDGVHRHNAVVGGDRVRPTDRRRRRAGARALEAIKWGTDYFIKAHTHPTVLWAQASHILSPLFLFIISSSSFSNKMWQLVRMSMNRVDYDHEIF